MALNHRGELFVGLEPLPLERRSPVLEEAPCPTFALVVPELAEGFLEQVRGVQPPVGSEQPLEGLATTARVANRAAQALRLAAAALRSSHSALGAYFRRLCSPMDKPKAVTAAAHKLARLIYTMLTKGEEYTDQGQDYYEERYRERVLRQLTKRTEKLDMQLIPVSRPI